MKKIFWGTFGLLLIFSIYILVFKYPEFQKKARESEVKLAFEMFKTAQDSYYDEWHKYSPVIKDVGFYPNLFKPGMEFFFRPEDLSSNEIKLLGDVAPYIQNYAYRVIGKFNGGNYTSYWSFDHSGNLAKIIEIPK